MQPSGRARHDAPSLARLSLSTDACVMLQPPGEGSCWMLSCYNFLCNAREVSSTLDACLGLPKNSDVAALLVPGTSPCTALLNRLPRPVREAYVSLDTGLHERRWKGGGRIETNGGFTHSFLQFLLIYLFRDEDAFVENHWAMETWPNIRVGMSDSTGGETPPAPITLDGRMRCVVVTAMLPMLSNLRELSERCDGLHGLSSRGYRLAGGVASFAFRDRTERHAISFTVKGGVFQFVDSDGVHSRAIGKEFDEWKSHDPEYNNRLTTDGRASFVFFACDTAAVLDRSGVTLYRDVVMPDLGLPGQNPRLDSTVNYVVHDDLRGKVEHRIRVNSIETLVMTEHPNGGVEFHPTRPDQGWRVLADTHIRQSRLYGDYVDYRDRDECQGDRCVRARTEPRDEPRIFGPAARYAYQVRSAPLWTRACLNFLLRAHQDVFYSGRDLRALKLFECLGYPPCFRGLVPDSLTNLFPTHLDNPAEAHLDKCVYHQARLMHALLSQTLGEELCQFRHWSRKCYNPLPDRVVCLVTTMSDLRNMRDFREALEKYTAAIGLDDSFLHAGGVLTWRDGSDRRSVAFNACGRQYEVGGQSSHSLRFSGGMAIRGLEVGAFPAPTPDDTIPVETQAVLVWFRDIGLR